MSFELKREHKIASWDSIMLANFPFTLFKRVIEFYFRYSHSAFNTFLLLTLNTFQSFFSLFVNIFIWIVL